MKVVITGGTGFIGSSLLEALLKRGDQPIVLTRHQKKVSSDSKITYLVWNPEDERSIVKEFDGVDAVLNFLGVALS